MNTKPIVIVAILAVLAVVALRVFLDPPINHAHAGQAHSHEHSGDHTSDHSHDEKHEHMESGVMFEVGDLVIKNVVARSTVPGASVGGGYLVITNNGANDDRLVGAQTSISNSVEVHEMSMENDIMKMRQLNDGLAIKAGETVVLEPGGYHLMFMQLNAPLEKGSKFTAVLNFEKAGEIEVEFDIQDLRMMKMNH